MKTSLLSFRRVWTLTLLLMIPSFYKAQQGLSLRTEYPSRLGEYTPSLFYYDGNARYILNKDQMMFSYVAIRRYNLLEKHLTHQQELWKEAVAVRDSLIGEKDNEIFSLRTALAIEEQKSNLHSQKSILHQHALNNCEDINKQLNKDLKRTKLVSDLKTVGILLLVGGIIYVSL